jgi:hypothetical protein
MDKYKRRKIRFSNFIFKQIQNLHTDEIIFLKEIGLYDPRYKSDIRNIGISKLTSGRINHKAVLLANCKSGLSFKIPEVRG